MRQRRRSALAMLLQSLRLKEAAAITTAVLLAKSIEEEPVKIHDFIINRPFAYIIRDTTGTILFMGKVGKL